MSSSQQTKTIPEFFDEAPDTDTTEVWRTCWDILSDLRDRTFERFDVEPHPSSSSYSEWSSGEFEGSLNTYTGPEAEWVVHSWIGNKSKGILDMNFQVWLGPHVDAPHLVIVFGTIPHIFHYSDLIPRRELATNVDYLARYYDPANEEFLKLRGDDRFEWSVSHGTYMRSVLSPIAQSLMAEPSEDVLATLRGAVGDRVDRWFGYVDSADEVPQAERAALSARDHYLREQIYRLDPMNALAKRFMDPDLAETLVDARLGAEQIAAAGS